VIRVATWLRRNFAQDDFAEDWYAWATNQISHASMGVMAALAVSLIAWLITGEYPVKWQAWSIVAVLSGAIGAVSWVLKGYADELQRISILLNKTREEAARDYVTKAELHADIGRVLARIESLDQKIDRILQGMLK